MATTKTRTKTKSTSIGIYGHRIMGHLYRYGCLTSEQIQLLGDFSPSTVDHQLKPLRDSGRVVKASDKTLWHSPAVGAPRALYYLGYPAGIRAGARALGEEHSRSALKNYKRIQLPETAVHRVHANEYLLGLQANPPDTSRVPLSEVFSESNPDFPLFGSGRPKSARKDAPYRFTAIVPDAVFGMEIGGGDERYTQHYHLELESELRKKHVLEKVHDYLGRWRRLIHPNIGEVRFHNPTVRLEPLVILNSTVSDHEKLLAHLRAAVPELEDYESAREAIWKSSNGSVSPLDMVLCAPHGAAVSSGRRPIYRTLGSDRAVNPNTVSLVEASETAGQIEILAKKAARIRAKAEAEAAEEAAKEAE